MAAESHSFFDFKRVAQISTCYNACTARALPPAVHFPGISSPAENGSSQVNQAGGARKQPTAIVAALRKFQKSLGHLGSLLFSPAYSDGRIRTQNAQVELEVPSFPSDGGLGCITLHREPGGSSLVDAQ